LRKRTTLALLAVLLLPLVIGGLSDQETVILAALGHLPAAALTSDATPTPAADPAADRCRPGAAYTLGDTGPCVTQLQRMLAGLGYDVAATGVYRRQTAIAVQAFQAYVLGAATGVADRRTWSALVTLYERGIALIPGACPYRLTPVDTLTARDPNVTLEQVLAMEDEVEAVIWNEQTRSTGLAAQAAELERRLAALGWRLEVTSAYRPQAYQDHLREIRDAYFDTPELQENPACQAVHALVAAELAAHQLGTVVAEVSTHTAGKAFDANVYDEHGNLLTRPVDPAAPDYGLGSDLYQRVLTLDRLAAEVGLQRPFLQNDPVHFQQR
jgi:peptidoglycan hydrolase-like protein with peptidoglycan-binding domain